jgi:hypothetical protein
VAQCLNQTPIRYLLAGEQPKADHLQNLPQEHKNAHLQTLYQVCGYTYFPQKHKKAYLQMLYQVCGYTYLKNFQNKKNWL